VANDKQIRSCGLKASFFVSTEIATKGFVHRFHRSQKGEMNDMRTCLGDGGLA